MSKKQLLKDIDNLEGDELAVVTKIVSRMTMGRAVYGPWNVQDGRNYKVEALEEILDLANYISTELVKQDRIARPFVYLACPYTHVDENVKRRRFESVTEVAAKLILQGDVVFSPITHSHPLGVYSKLPTDWDFWKIQDSTYLEHSRKLVVLCLDGWRTSTGVQAEIKIAQKMKIPVEYITEENEALWVDRCSVLTKSGCRDMENTTGM